MNLNRGKSKSSPLLKKRRGFTFIELVIVIAIIIILAGVSIPQLQGFIASQRLQSVSWQLVQDLKTVKEDAILYQQDLNFYFNYGNSPVEPTNPNNNNNRYYLYEVFQYDSLNNLHYIPTDPPGNKFNKRVLKYGIVIDNISCTPDSSVTFAASKYFVVTFRSGAGSTFRGKADITTAISSRKNTSTSSISSNYLILRLKDTQGHLFYVIINAAGNISMSGSPPT